MAKEFKNTFSWSVSRDRTFQECPRQYYFNYYGYWDGWHTDAPPRTREIYVLKKLKSRPIWSGQVVHECIARSLQNLSRNVGVLDIEEILDITRNRMRQDFRHSRDKRYWQNPKEFCALFDHEYDIAVPDDQWREAADTVDHCLKSFYTSDVYDQLKRTEPTDFLEIERLTSFDIDGMPVSLRVDCATREHDTIVVWDWKTGKRESGGGLSLQMACYAHYARSAFNVGLGGILTRRFDLYHGNIYEEPVNERSLTELFTYMRGSIKDMLSLLDDRAENTVSEERFRKVEKRQICSRCNFLKVCKPEI